MLRSHCNRQSHDPTGIDWNPWNRTSLSPSEPRTKSVTQTANGDSGEVRGERRATPQWRNKARDERQGTDREGSNLNLREDGDTSRDFNILRVFKCVLTSAVCATLRCLFCCVVEQGGSAWGRPETQPLHAALTDRAILYRHNTKQNESLSCKISIWNETFMKKSCYGYNGLDQSGWCLYPVPLLCNCGIKREQLVARCHGKTPFPICYSHAE